MRHCAWFERFHFARIVKTRMKRSPFLKKSSFILKGFRAEIKTLCLVCCQSSFFSNCSVINANFFHMVFNFDLKHLTRRKEFKATIY